MNSTKFGAGFILASQSPRRHELLKNLIPEFEVLAPDVQELGDHAEGSVALVLENARMKAEAVSKGHPDHWVLGADTIVTLGNTVLGKPNNLDHAMEMLLSLSDQTHAVHTGICLVNASTNYFLNEVVSSHVTFKRLDPSMILEYFQFIDPLDKAGAYGIQTKPEMIIDSYQGSLTNIIGLPLERMNELISSILIH